MHHIIIVDIIDQRDKRPTIQFPGGGGGGVFPK